MRYPFSANVRLINRNNWSKAGLHLSRGINFVSRLHTYDTPLPAHTPDASNTFQSWHRFDSTHQQWSRIESSDTHTPLESPQKAQRKDNKLVLVTWNVDAASQLPADRISAIVSKITSLKPFADIVFFQEVSRIALRGLLQDERIRQLWLSSEVDESSWGRRPFATMTLLSKARFAYGNGSSNQPMLGPIWRVKYPSMFERDALCCDVFLPSSPGILTTTRVRLANVHLDSLAIQPSRRPRQMSIVSSMLQSAGRGVVAGDFNPVLPEDEALVRDSGLTDVWAELHPNEAGHTWGINGEEPFPPNRLDKIAVVGLRASDIEILPPPWAAIGEEKRVPSSDHSGLACCIEVSPP